MDVSPAYKEGDEADEALFGETEDEAEDNAGSDESPLHWRRRGPAPPRPHPAGNEGEDFPRLYEAPPAGNETEDIAGSAEALPRCQRGRATQKTRKSRTR